MPYSVSRHVARSSPLGSVLLFFLGLVFEQREPRVEKQIEFFDLDAEHSGEYVVAKLMDDYQ